MTNGDKIRKMSDEQLLDFLFYFENDECDFCVYTKNDNCHCSICTIGHKKWLEREAMEE